MAAIKIPIETSARHVHLTRRDFEALYGPGRELTPERPLSQPGQYLAAERVTVVGPRGTFENVGILGPFRSESQVEMSLTDNRKLGIESVIRQSGFLEDTPGCVLVRPDTGDSITLPRGVIVAKRHIHMTPEDALRMNVRDNEDVCIMTKSYERSMIFADVVVRVHRSFRLAMHVDTDEANAFAPDDEAPYGLILKLFDSSTYSFDSWTRELLSGIRR